MSVVDNKLKSYGFVFKLSPYRIEAENGTLIQAGPTFDLRDSTLKAQQNAHLKRLSSRFGSGIPKQN